MMTITLEAVLLGAILHDFLPWLPIWAGAFLMLVTLMASNATRCVRLPKSSTGRDEGRHHHLHAAGRLDPARPAHDIPAPGWSTSPPMTASCPTACHR
jgi:hypothetical protein